MRKREEVRNIPTTCACEVCDLNPRALVAAGKAIVIDDIDGRVFADAFHWHNKFFGVRPALTEEEALTLEAARAWMAEHR